VPTTTAKKRHPFRALLLLLGAVALLYLAAWPTPVDPEDYTAPPIPKREGLFAPNGKLAAVEWLARGFGEGPEAILFDAAGGLYTGYADGRIVRMKPDGTGAQAVAKTGGRPLGLAFGARGALYVADADNHVIRSLDLAARSVTTVAGTGEQAYRITRGGAALETPLSSPWDLALRNGTLYIAMAGLHQIWTLDLERATLAVWAGTGHEALKDGPRTEAWLAQPMGVSLSDESLYVACAEAQSVRRIDLANGEVTTLVGTGLFAFGDEDGDAADALLQHNQDVEWGAEAIYVADTNNFRVQVLANRGPIRAVGGMPGMPSFLGDPVGVAVDSHNNLYVTTLADNDVKVFSPNGTFLRAFGSQGTGPGQFNLPEGIAIDSQDNVYVAERGGNRIQKISSAGKFISSYGERGTQPGQFDAPFAVALDSNGDMVIADARNNRIQKVAQKDGGILLPAQRKNHKI